MDFHEPDEHLEGIDDEGITMDSEVSNDPGSTLQLSVTGQESTEVMGYLLPSANAQCDIQQIESIVEQEGISIASSTLQEQQDPSVLKMDLPISAVGGTAQLGQQSVVISLSQDGQVIVKKEDNESQLNQGAATILPSQTTQIVNQEGEITLVNLQTETNGNDTAISRAANSLVQLTSDGKVNIVSRDSVIPQLQQVMLADGTVAYLNATATSVSREQHSTPQIATTESDHSAFVTGNASQKDSLQAVRLDDGSIAYITASIIPEGSAIDASAITLDQPDKEESGGTDGQGTETSNTGVENGNSTWTSASGLVGVESQLPNLLPQPTLTLSPQKQQSNNRSTTSLGDKAYKCPFEGCFRVYTTVHHLKVHERSHTGDKPYCCEFTGCDKSFSTAYALKSHSRVHTGEKPYKCPMEECVKAFKTSGDLQKHVRTHTGEKPFKCPFEGCNKSFTTSNIRKVHIRVHTGERPYVCPMDDCGKSFSSATNYKNHVRIHTGERPYVCAVQGCGKRFTEYSSLYKHHIVHTHSKPYVCVHCGKTYRQTSTLAMHKRTAHNDDSGATDAEIVLAGAAPQILTMPSAGSEDSEGALVINTADNAQLAVDNKLTVVSSISSPATSVTQQATPPPITTVTSLANNISVIQAPTNGGSGGHEGLALPAELQGQRVFVITEPAQLQILQHLAQSQQIQILNTTESQSIEGQDAQAVTAECSIDPQQIVSEASIL